MTVREAIQARRSIRHFDPAYLVSDDELRDLLAPLRHTPTSFNLQHFRVITVRSEATKVALAEAAYGQSQLAECSAVVVILSKLPAHEDAARIWEDAPERVRDGMLENIHGLYDHDDALRRDEAIRSGSLAAMALMLTAVELGLGTSPLIGFDDARVREILEIPADHLVVLLLCVGRIAAPPRPRVGVLALEQLVAQERFGGPPLTSTPG